MAEWRGGYLNKTLEKRHNNDMGSNPILITKSNIMENIKQQILKRAEERLKANYSNDIRQRILMDMNDELKLFKQGEEILSKEVEEKPHLPQFRRTAPKRK